MHTYKHMCIHTNAHAYTQINTCTDTRAHRYTRKVVTAGSWGFVFCFDYSVAVK